MKVIGFNQDIIVGEDCGDIYICEYRNVEELKWELIQETPPPRTSCIPRRDNQAIFVERPHEPKPEDEF